MDPLKTAPSTPQDPLSGATSNTPVDQAFVQGVAATDDCALDLLALFDTDSAITAQYENEQQSLAPEEQKLEQAIHLEATNKDIETIGKEEETESIAHLLQAEDAIHNVCALNIEDGQLVVKRASSLTTDNLDRAKNDAGAMAFLHGDNIFMSSDFAASRGYVNGQEITYKDENGKEHKVKVQILSADDFKVLSNLVTNHFAAEAGQESQEKTEKDVGKSKEKHDGAPVKHTFTPFHKNTKRTGREDRKPENGENVLSTRTSGLKQTEKAKEEAAREREHGIQELNRFIEKHLKIISSENMKHDIAHQNLISDNFKKDHDFRQIPRATLNDVKHRAGG